MGLSRSEWMDAAEHGAAVEWGREHKSWFVAKHAAPFVGVSLLLGGVGLGSWWLYRKAAAAVHSIPTAHGDAIPTWVWFVVAVTALATPLVFRSRYGYTPRATMVLKVVAVVIVWLGVAGLLIGSAVG